MRIFARRLFDGKSFLQNQVVTVKENQIAAVESGTTGDISADILAPGLIDLHHHGAWGFDTTHPTWD
jgi:N-acetylglucosamine-6-phosphate deacetylase